MGGAGAYVIILANEQDDDALWEVGLGLAIAGGVTAPFALIWYLVQALEWPDFEAKNWVSPREANEILEKAAATTPVLAQKMECFTWSIVEKLRDKLSLMK